MLSSIIRLTRPKQWTKNLFIFAPLFFGGSLTNTNAIILATLAFLAYNFTASSIYCFNDIIDLEADRNHPVKRNRPIASGKVSKMGGYTIMFTSIIIGLALMVAMIGFGNGIDPAKETFVSPQPYNTLAAAGVILFYYGLNLSYCTWLKRYAIIDVCIIAFGFVLRILVGGLVTGVIVSHWLVLMTFLLTLLLSLAKRRDDVLKMIKTGEPTRKNTSRYNLEFINQSITVLATGTLVCYIMYTVSPEVVARTNFNYVYLTTVFVLLGLLRYLQRTIVDANSGDPTRLLLTDRFLQLVVAMWLAAFFLIIYVI